MTSLNTPLASTEPAALRPGKAAATRRVIDAPTRMFHWLFALCFVGAYLTSDGERLRLLHVTLGYSMAGLLGFRVLYGLVGPRQVRLSALWGKLRPALLWLRAIKSAWSGQPSGTSAAPSRVNWRQGPNLAMAAATATMLLLVLPLTLSGYATCNDWGGEWLEELHEAFGEFFLWVVLAHLGLLLGLSLLRRKNQAHAMLSGRIEGAGPDLARRNHVWLATLLLAAVLSYWVWEWQQPPTGGDGGATRSSQAADERRHRHDDDAD